MAWFSPRSDVFAYRSGAGLEVQTALGRAALSGDFADDFLEAFLSSEGRAAGRLEPLARLGSDLHRAVIAAARAGGGAPWVPLATRQTPTLFLELTGQCNEACAHCYAGSSPAVEVALDEAACQRVIGEGAALGFQRLQFTGGDPLLCPFLGELAAESRAAGWKEIEVYTNGLALSPERLKGLAAHGVAFAFSFYSHDAKAHDAITGVPGSQRRTLDAIRAAVAAGSKVRASIIAFSGDADGVERTREALVRVGVPAAAVWVDRVRRVGRGAEIPPGSSEARPLPGGHSGAAAVRDVRWPGKACVSYSGEVFPCIFARSMPLGSVHRESLGVILERARTTRGRQAVAVAGLADQLACFDCQLTAIASAESVEAA